LTIPEGFDAFKALASLFRGDVELQNPKFVVQRVRDAGYPLERFFRRLEQILDLKESSISLTSSGLFLSMSNGVPYPLHALGSGYQSTILWICDFLGWAFCYDPRFLSAEPTGIVLIDELEQHLHPRWQRLVIHRLATQFPDVQFIASSYSAICKEGLADLDEHEFRLFLLERNEDEQIVRCREVPVRTDVRHDKVMTDESSNLPGTGKPRNDDFQKASVPLVKNEPNVSNDPDDFEPDGLDWL
jgi:hypothetical protein